MTINSFLCKCFDSEKKGYVTIGAIIATILFLCAILIFGSMVLFMVGGITGIIIYYLSPDFSPTISECVVSACENEKIIAGVLIGLGFAILIVIAIGLLILIFRIKIAKCERR